MQRTQHKDLDGIETRLKNVEYDTDDFRRSIKQVQASLGNLTESIATAGHTSYLAMQNATLALERIADLTNRVGKSSKSSHNEHVAEPLQSWSVHQVDSEGCDLQSDVQKEPTPEPQPLAAESVLDLKDQVEECCEVHLLPRLTQHLSAIVDERLEAKLESLAVQVQTQRELSINLEKDLEGLLSALEYGAGISAEGTRAAGRSPQVSSKPLDRRGQTAGDLHSQFRMFSAPLPIVKQDPTLEAAQGGRSDLQLGDCVPLPAMGSTCIFRGKMQPRLASTGQDSFMSCSNPVDLQRSRREIVYL